MQNNSEDSSQFHCVWTISETSKYKYKRKIRKSSRSLGNPHPEAPLPPKQPQNHKVGCYILRNLRWNWEVAPPPPQFWVKQAITLSLILGH